MSREMLIRAWEDAGHDYASWPGLDRKARELAGHVPGPRDRPRVRTGRRI